MARAAGEVDLVHALGASGLGYALARRRPETPRAVRLQPAGPRGVRRHASGLRAAEAARLHAAAGGGARCAQAADAIIATDRALVATVRAAPRRRSGARPRHAERDRSRRRSIARARAAADRRGAARPARRWPPASVLLLSVGRLEENKGFHVLAARARRRCGARGRSRPRAGAGCSSATVRIAPRIAGAHRRRRAGSRTIHLAGRVADERAGRAGTKPPTSSCTRRSTKAARS